MSLAWGGFVFHTYGDVGVCRCIPRILQQHMPGRCLNDPASFDNFLTWPLPSLGTMPTYEFRCEAGHSFDRFLKMSEAPSELPCTECGEPAKRQMSAGAGLVFKGSGFYLTDYGRAGQKPGSEAATSASGDSKASDSKPTTSDSTSAASTAASPAKSDKSSSAKTPKPSE